MRVLTCILAHTIRMRIYIFFECGAEIYRRGEAKGVFAHLHMFTIIYYELGRDIQMRGARMGSHIHLIYIFFEYWAEIYRKGGPSALSRIHLICV